MIFRFAFEKLFKAREAATKARMRPGADDGYDPHEKPFLDHLEDLRKTLGKMLIFTVVVTIFAFIFNKQIFEFVQLPAKRAAFDDGTTLFDKINFLTLKPQEILMLSIKTSFFAALILSFPALVWFAGEFILPGLRQSEKRYVIPGVGIGFILFLIGASFAFFMAAPLALKFFYEFSLERFGMLTPAIEERSIQYEPIRILPGTEEADKPAPASEPGSESDDGKTEEATDPGVEGAAEPGADSPVMAKPGSSSLDAETKEAVRNYLGELLVVERGSELAIYYDAEKDKILISDNPIKRVSYQIGEYINFITRLTLVFGISFQLPVVVVVLVKLELLTARVMRNTRSYAWVVILIAAAIFTPPDIITLGLLAGPLLVLYEICIWIAWLMERRREKERAAEEAERAAEAAARQERLAALYAKSHEELTEEEKNELHQHEIEQYEKEHAHLYEEDPDHIAHDPHHGDHDHHDEYGHPYDPEHDDGWHHEDEEHHYDEGHDPFHGDGHDPHAGEAAHEPVQDWPDQEDESHQGLAESDHVAGRDIEEPAADEDFAHDDDVCEPDGPVVNLNSASEEELCTLPGIGPAMAKRLIGSRPFTSFDDVSGVPGIGDSKLYAMIERLSIDEIEEDDEAREAEAGAESSDSPAESEPSKGDDDSAASPRD